jgi:hypothetical protein
MNTPPPSQPSDARWHFLRDVLVLQFKLLLGNLQNFLLVPVSVGAALIDLIFKRRREGERFYAVLEWSRRFDEGINLYGAIGGYHATGADPAPDAPGSEPGVKKDFDVDTIVQRVEKVILREYEKGGTAASLKSAVDRVLDQLQREKGDKPSEPASPSNKGSRGDAQSG